MTRIVAGRFGGRHLEVPRSGTRPTSERVREAIFARLAHENALADARVLDLFAGSGALGLEAMSRGGSQLLLIDDAEAAIRACQANIRALQLEGAKAIRAGAGTFLQGTAGKPADLVFLDPPYNLGEEQLTSVLETLAREEDPWLERASVVVVERSTRSPEPTWPARIHPYATKTYGETAVYYAELD